MTWYGTTHPAWLRYSVTILIIAIAAVIRFVYFADLGRGSPYLTFYPLVVIAALYGGLLPGVLASIVSVLLSFYWVQLGSMSPAETLSMVVFLFSCTLISFICESMRRSQAYVKQAHDGLRNEIAERRKFETLALQGEEKYRKIIEMTHTGFLILDDQGLVLEANAEYVRLTGRRDLGEILGKSVLEWTALHDTEQNRQAMAQCLNGGHIQGLQIDYIDADGRITPVEIDATKEGAGDTLRIMSLCRDATERRRRESEARMRADIIKYKLINDELRDSQRRLALATGSAKIGIWDWDVLANSMTWDAQMFALYGVSETPGPVGVEIWEKGLHPDDKMFAWDACQAALRGDKEYDIEFRVQHPVGQVRHIKANGLVLRGENGIPVRMIGVNFDITERTLAEEELHFRALLLDSVQDAMLCIDEHGTIITVNQAMLRDTGYALKEFVGQHVGMLYPSEDAAVATQRTQDIITQGSATFNVTHIRKDGSTYPVEVFARSAIIHGKLFIIAVGRDISDRIVVENALRAAKEQAESANLAKSHFLATMSHEIRTPLSGVIGMADMLQETNLSPDQTTMVKIVQDCGNSLLSVIGDVLDLAQIESGAFALVPKELDVRILTGEIQGMFTATTKTKGLRLAVSVDPSVPTRLQGDTVRLRQVLLNLLGNAVKFTEHGEVAVTVTVTGSSLCPDCTTVVWEVQDTGPGIPAEYLPHLFEPFTQADSSMTRKYGGTGLGLAITKRLTDLMGGTICVETEIGGGTCFRFAVPLKNLAEVKAPVAACGGKVATGAGSRQLSVLVVEDDSISQITLDLMLTELGCSHLLAKDGNEAIAAVAAGTFDLVLMDCQMPECDGYSATRTIRANAAPEARRLPIIALTANVFIEDCKRCSEAGMDDFLAKPCTLDSLRKCLHSWVVNNQDSPDTRATLEL